MPAFLPPTTRPVTIYPGQSIALVNNADSGITSTLQVAIGPDPMGNYQLTLVNSTNQTATAQVAPNDPVLPTPAAGSYESYSVTVGPGKSESFACFGPWFNCTFASAPTSGSLVLSR